MRFFGLSSRKRSTNEDQNTIQDGETSIFLYNMNMKFLLLPHYSKKNMKRSHAQLKTLSFNIWLLAVWKMNSLPSSLWVIYRSLLRILIHVRVMRHLVDQIQNKFINHIYSHHLSFTKKKETRTHHLGVN